jgi:hypothetical protein
MERMRLGGGYLPAFPSHTNQAQHRAEGIEALLPQPRTPPHRGGNERERAREGERERENTGERNSAGARERDVGRERR